MEFQTLNKSQELLNDFLKKDKIYPLEDVISASIEASKDSSMRNAVKKFYTSLFEEVCHHYCIMNTNKKELKMQKLSGNSLLMKFTKALNSTSLNNNNSRGIHDNKSGINVKNDQQQESMIFENEEDGPQSPPQEMNDDFEMEDSTLSSSTTTNYLVQNDLALFMMMIDKQLLRIREALAFLIKNIQKKDNPNLMNQKKLTQSQQQFDDDDLDQVPFQDWPLAMATNLSKKYYHYIDIDLKNSSNTLKLEKISLTKTLVFWKQCSVMQILINLIFDSIEQIVPKVLIDKILFHSPYSDWILASLFIDMSLNKNQHYIEQLINNSSLSKSTFHVLSLISEHDPYSIVNCSKSNIPFLLELCADSQILLDLLAQEIVQKIDIPTLNRLAESPTFDGLKSNILYCLYNAPNSFELLKISFDLIIDPQSSRKLVERILDILLLLAKEFHQFIYQSNMISKKNIDPLLVVLRDNIHKLMLHPAINKNPTLKRLLLKLLSLTCIHCGKGFITESLYHLMNVSYQSINSSNYEQPKLNNFITTLLNSLRIHIGFEIYDCIKETLELNQRKKLAYWANLMALIEVHPMEIEPTRLINYLNQKSNNDDENIYKIYYILKIFKKYFDVFQDLYTRQQYRLCTEIVSLYFDLMEMAQEHYEGYRLSIIMNCIVLCQNFLKDLAQNYSLNESIIGRCILDFIQDKDYLFSKQYSAIVIDRFSKKENINENSISLLDKNLHLNPKFRKKPLIPGSTLNANKKQCKENKSAIFNQLLVQDLIQDCIKNKLSFANDFTNSLAKNESLFCDAPWLEEDPKDGQLIDLRATIEIDLKIYRSFSSNPVLWNILQFLSKNMCLTHCLVIIRCIINVLRNSLFSTTPYTNDDIVITQRFISLIANDEILPCIPFNYIPEAIPEKIKPLEMAWILLDLTKYIRDKHAEQSSSQEPIPIKPYINRLRIILAHKKPDEFYLKILKNL